MSKRQSLDLYKLLPLRLQNETSRALMSNLFNRFVSEEQSVNVSGRIGLQVEGDPQIKSPTLDRELNSLIPVLHFKAGTEDNVLTFNDIVNRATALGLDVENMKRWMAEQAFNFAPPINFDKFINYSNYYWIEGATALPWNPDALPEYYVIARPSPFSKVKMDVDVATTAPIKLTHANRNTETLTIEFISSTAFTVSGSEGAVLPSSITLTSSVPGEKTTVSLRAPASSGIALENLGDPDGPLCEFTLTNGQVPFTLGDKFEITIEYGTSNVSASFLSPFPSGKGAVSGIASKTVMQWIDGVKIKVGTRILVKNQNNHENGIYLVATGGKIVRAYDAQTDQNLSIGSKVMVLSGDTLARSEWQITAATVDPLADDGVTSTLTFTQTSAPGTAYSRVNTWQSANRWYHIDEIQEQGLSQTGIVQATRPIIEYPEGLKLTESFNPEESEPIGTTFFRQSRRSINQIPLFDLYYYDGTPANRSSSIFFYVEDPDYPIDSQLFKRVKTTENADFVFGVGITDEEGRHLYYLNSSILQTVWTSCSNGPVIYSLVRNSVSDGNLSILMEEHADIQDWLITFTSATQYTVFGSRSGNLGNGFVDVPFVCPEMNLTISAGTLPFAENDTITWSTYNKLSPRYVKLDSEGRVVNDYSDPDLEVNDKTWLVPLRMFQNVDRLTEYEIAFGDLLNHMRSVIKEQDGFSGSSFGRNNTYKLPFDASRGGAIRDFGSNFPLFCSMMFQDQISPITMIDFAEQQYVSALSSIDQYLINHFANYLASGNAVFGETIDAYAPEIIKLFADYEQLRATDQVLSDVFRDTTAGIANWPITLPQMGMMPKTTPGIRFDFEIGADMLVHHDGHVSPIAQADADFNRELVKTIVTRSDGTSSAGIFSESMPTTPYARQLWLKPSTFELKVFDVDFDTDTQPSAKQNGDVWFKRSTGQLYVWEQNSQSWSTASFSVSSRWKLMSPENIRNSLILHAEFRLYDNIHPAQLQVIDLSDAEDSKYAELELAKYSSKYNIDAYAPNYNATDAFTWNYSQATMSDLVNVPARWYDIYKQYIATFGGVQTCRPNLEPWKILGYASEPVTWNSQYACTIYADESKRVANVRAVATTSVSLLFGIQTIDGVALSNGDRVLLTNQSLPIFNGIYVVSSAGWSRSSDVLQTGTTVSVTEGERAGTTWVITTPSPIVINTSNIVFEQARMWSAQMWADIKSLMPANFKLGVNVHTDELLPPYSTNAEALISVIPPGISDEYVFGDNGPGELVWTKSLEYSYGLARSLFRLNPMYFLDKTWGYTYVQHSANEFRVERNLVNTLPPSKFLLHGEKLNIQNVYNAEDIAKRLTGSLQWFGAAMLRAEVACVGDNQTIFNIYVDGDLVGYVREGQAVSFTYNNITVSNFKIEDKGIPFSLGEAFTIEFFNDIVDPNYVAPTPPALELGCEGCVSPDTPDEIIDVPMVQVPPVMSHIPAVMQKFVGMGQVFTNLLRYSYIDTSVSRATLAYRGWSSKLGHRFGALIREDSLKIKTAQGNLPTTAYSVLLKRSPNTRSIWMSALRIQLVEMGSRKLNEFGIYVPSTDGSDWKFRIESYNPQNPELEYYELDKNGSYQTFYALQQQNTDLPWKHLSDKVQLSTFITPIVVTGIQNVVDIVYGYVDRLEELGFVNSSLDKSSIDAETGRNLDWQLEVEKFVDRIYSGVSAGEGHILNPYMESFWVKTPVGLLSQYSSTNFIDVYSAQSVVDVTGTIIPVDNLTVIRTDEETSTSSTTPMFAAHVFIDEYEHLLLINNRFSDETNAAIAFSPFLGLRINSAYLDYTRQEVQDGKPTFDGFFLSGNKVARNITSSIENISGFYDPIKTFNEPTTAKHALALLGYSPKSYFDDLTTSDVTQFNFWRGLIQAKGTNLTVDAFVNYKRFASAEVDEYWAYKLAEFGDAREKTFPEIKINTQDCSQKFTRLQFFSDSDPDYNALPQYIQIENNDDTRWFSINDLSKGLRFEAQRITETVSVPATASFPAYIRLSNIFHNGDDGVATVTTTSGSGNATIVNASLIKVDGPGEFTVSGYTWMNPTKLSPIKLFDFQQQELISEIGLWHPAIGLHSPLALEVVDIVQKTDPANYNYTTKTRNNPNFKHLKPWGPTEVGRVWWDTSNLGYVPYYDASVFPSRDARHARWGALAEWASVNLYQWVESPVHPSEYDALASSEEGRADIPKSQRASGKAALKKYYKRDRIITGHPIAWSQNGGRIAVDQDPSLGPAEYVKVFSGISSVQGVDGVLFADTGRTSEIGLNTDVHFGGWKNSKPFGEVIITGDLEYAIGSSEELITSNGNVFTSPNLTELVLNLIESNSYGYEVGSIKFQKLDDGVTITLRASSQTGVYADVVINDWVEVSADSVSQTFDFDRVGLSLTVTRGTSGTISASTLVDEIVNALSDVYVREGVRFTKVFDLPDSVFINDDTDPMFPLVDYGYRTWTEPSQSQLNADLLSPHNKWFPILGDDVSLVASSELTAKMTDSANTKTLKSGVQISRYSSSWTDWEELLPMKLEKISDGQNVVTFILPVEIDSNRLSIYANGVQVNPAAINITFNSATLAATYPEGTTLFMLYRAYQPTEQDLGFDPDIEEDFDIQTQYKSDFQYTKVDVRDSTGNVSSSKYYFWVEEKTIPADNKNMSLQQARIDLEQGPSTYALFSRLLPAEQAYDSCAIAGLNNQVTKNNAYKLRFLRDFTLRDDPEQLNLKNTHTEWVLMRRGQSSRIPEQLWNVLTNAVSGQDEFGQPVPSQVRIDYDQRNGTRTRYGFKSDQIFADTNLVVASIVNTILNTSLTINLGSKKITDYITALDLNKSEEWFATPDAARATMDLIWNTARPKQINEIFFSVLDDALASNYEFTDIFKTSFITVNSTTNINQAQYGELADDIH